MTEKTARPSRFPGNGTEREAGQNAGGLARAPSRWAPMPRDWLIYCGIGLGALVIRLIYLLDICLLSRNCGLFPAQVDRQGCDTVQVLPL